MAVAYPSTAEHPKIILLFLDIDGVLLSLNITNAIFQEFLNYIKTGDVENLKRVGVNQFDKQALERLHTLISHIEQTGRQCGIVMSSSWRSKLSVEQLKQLFSPHRFAQYIIDKTPYKEGLKLSWRQGQVCPFKFSRGESIDVWLRENGKKYNTQQFLVIDDTDDGISSLYGQQFLHCQDGVFSDADLKRGIEVLKHQASAFNPLQLNDLTGLVQDNQGQALASPPVRITEQRRKDLLTPLFKLYLDNKDLGELVSEYDKESPETSFGASTLPM